ncbi:MAG: ABC transporter ATP-binding protein [Bacteroidota bacterium]
MGEPIIKVEGLSKQYILNKSLEPETELLASKLLQGIRNLKNVTKRKETQNFLALDDVSFTVNQGDRVGIIGRNGAGKSTLLKILSRITPPTKGRIELNGRIASLLEVGTGFHGDLSGRENIYLNGSILGMTKKEIDRKFDEIVAFSEIEQFLDTPVKRYSSGMYVRLAFSVAAHLESDVLIVDEVLAVGDSVFQRRCIDKMISIANDGKTLFFVSHNLSSVSALCDRAILLNKGKLIADGNVASTIEKYNNLYLLKGQKIDLTGLERTTGNQELTFEWIEFENEPLPFSENFVFKFKLKSSVKKTFTDVDFGFNVNDRNHGCIIHVSNRFINRKFDHSNDDVIYEVSIENNLKPGYYMMVLFVRTGDDVQDFLINQVSFEVGEGNPYGFNDTDQIQGNILPRFDISVK